jgi:hypothetical protein
MNAEEKVAELTEYGLLILATLSPQVRKTFFLRFTDRLPKASSTDALKIRAHNYRILHSAGLVTTKTGKLDITPLGKVVMVEMVREQRLRSWE